MNRVVYIYLEGEEDKNLVEQLVKFWNYGKIDIKVLDGYTNLSKRINEIRSYNDSGNSVLLILDADHSGSADKNNGFDNKIKYLESFKQDYKIDFQYFLFPNNKQDGTIEDFVRDIAKHKMLFDCWDNLWSCVNEKSKEAPIKYSEAGKKSMIYYYIECLFGISKSEREKMKLYRKKIDFSDDKWEIEKSESARELKSFLDKNIV